MSREMKDSRIEWIGEIPEDWKAIKTKNKFKNNKLIVGNEVDNYGRLSLTLNGVLKRSKEDANGLQPEKFEGYQILKKDQLVFKLIDLENVNTSRVGLSAYTGLVSPAYIILDNPKESKFGYYYFLSMWYQEIFNKLGGDGVRSNLNASDLLNIPYLDVTQEEKQKIADYLDEKVSEIDNIITQTTLSIEEYKKYKQSLITETVTKGLKHDVEMKDSGVEWIGEIPCNYKTVKLKRYSYIRYGLGEPPKLSDEGLPIIRATNIERGKIVKNDLIKARLEDIPSSKDVVLKEGDIIIVRSGAYAGDIAYITKEWEGALAGYDMIISITKIHSKFVSYALLSEYVLKAQLYLSRMRSAQPHLNAEEVGETTVVIPPLDEQQQIADYLDKKCSEIDNLITQKQHLLTEIESYKKSLIYECVTGKREVK